MATKRTPSEDFESPPLQVKHGRTEGQTYPFELPSTSPSSSPISQSTSPVSKLQVKGVRSKVMKNLKMKLVSVKSSHEALLKEKYFLENAGNIMDFLIWKKKPNVFRDQFLKRNEIDSSQNVSSDDATANVSTDTLKQHNLPSSTTIQIPLSTVSPTLHATPPKESTLLSPARSIITLPSSSPRPATRAHASFSSVYENSHEDIVMRARHEAEVMKSISELRKEGLWCSSRLPKVQEPPRVKTHWDYLLEEMQWLATDFNNEKRWKINAARKVCNRVTLAVRTEGFFYLSPMVSHSLVEV